MTTSPDAHSRVAVVTGASSGIGEASARVLAAQGFHVVAAARRSDRIERLADELGGTAVVVDVTDDASVADLAARLHRVDVLINNAGGAKGLTPVAEADLDDWRWMWETNVIGTLRVTRALLPKLVASGDGLIVTVTSMNVCRGSSIVTPSSSQRRFVRARSSRSARASCQRSFTPVTSAGSALWASTR